MKVDLVLITNTIKGYMDTAIKILSGLLHIIVLVGAISTLIYLFSKRKMGFNGFGMIAKYFKMTVEQLIVAVFMLKFISKRI